MYIYICISYALHRTLGNLGNAQLQLPRSNIYGNQGQHQIEDAIMHKIQVGIDFDLYIIYNILCIYIYIYICIRERERL